MRLLGTRLLQLIPVLIIVSILTFYMTELLPGDPVIAILGENAREEQIIAVRQELRLDQPLVTRYFEWAGDALKGDLGKSLRSNQPVMDGIVERLPVNGQLALMVVLSAIFISIPLGAWSAFRAGRAFDRSVTTTAFGLSSVPPFLGALLLVAVFAVTFEWLPVNGYFKISESLGKNLKHMILPTATLAFTEIAVYSQLLRADMAATMQQDFILAARARGLPVRHVLLREALRPSSFSLVTLSAVNLGRIIAGTVVVEQIFALPGVGRMIQQSIPQKDFPVLQGGVLVLATIYLILNLLVDVSYPLLDPRVRRAHR